MPNDPSASAPSCVIAVANAAFGTVDEEGCERVLCDDERDRSDIVLARVPRWGCKPVVDDDLGGV